MPGHFAVALARVSGTKLEAPASQQKPPIMAGHPSIRPTSFPPFSFDISERNKSGTEGGMRSATAMLVGLAAVLFGCAEQPMGYTTTYGTGPFYAPGYATPAYPGYAYEPGFYGPDYYSPDVIVGGGGFWADYDGDRYWYHRDHNWRERAWQEHELLRQRNEAATQAQARQQLEQQRAQAQAAQTQAAWQQQRATAQARALQQQTQRAQALATQIQQFGRSARPSNRRKRRPRLVGKAERRSGINNIRRGDLVVGLA